MKKYPNLLILGMLAGLMLAGCGLFGEEDTAVPPPVPVANVPVVEPVNVEPAPIIIPPDTPQESPIPIIVEPLAETFFIDPPVGSNLAVGSTVQHEVSDGDWLMQIARCYGASYSAVRRQNSHIVNANRILIQQTITVPNIGSEGAVMGAPCTNSYTVQPGDTWPGLAQQFGSQADILRNINPGSLVAGKRIFVPNHQPISASVPKFNQDLMFNYDGNLAIWKAENGRLEILPTPNYLSGFVVDGSGQKILARQYSVETDSLQLVLIDREARTISLLESNLATLAIETDSQPLTNAMLLSDNGEWGAYFSPNEIGFRLVTFRTDNPQARNVLEITRDVVMKNETMIFKGDTNDNFIWSDSSGTYRFAYTLEGGERLLHANTVSEALPSDLPVLFPLAWSPQGRFLLTQARTFVQNPGQNAGGGRGIPHFVLDNETGQIIEVPNAVSYLIQPSLTWRQDGSLLVLSPAIGDGSTPGVSVYKPEVVDNGLTLSLQSERSLTIPGIAENSVIIRFEAPAYQTGNDGLLVVVWTQEAALNGLYRLSAGDAPALQTVELFPVEAIDETLFTPDGSGILRDMVDQESGFPDVRFISTDGSPDFSLLSWLGFKIANFNWVPAN